MAKLHVPPVSFRFEVKFYHSDPAKGAFVDSDDPDARFQEVSGLSVEFETEEAEDGANARYVQRLPKKPKFRNLVLKRGLLLNSKIFNWFNDLLTNSDLQIVPLNAVVSLKNEESQTLLKFTFVKAWPQKWALSDLNAMQSELAIETIELTYQYFQINQMDPAPPSPIAAAGQTSSPAAT